MVRQNSADVAVSCEMDLRTRGDEMWMPSLTLLVRPTAATEADLTVLADVSRLTTGPTLTVDAAEWDTTVSEAIAAIRSAE